MQSAPRHETVLLQLLVWKGLGATFNHGPPATLLRSDMWQAPHSSSQMSTSVRITMSCRTLPALLTRWPDKELFLR